jgi:protein SCO1/2
MTMPFKIKDTTFLYKVEPGDSIQGTLAVSRTESWLASMSVTSKGEPPRVLRAGDIEMKRLFRVGEVFPDETLTNQDGRRIKFSDFRGKALAVTFIYTRCPIPDFCIRMSDYFAKVQRLLKQEPAIANKWHLLTISFDPQFDTPKVLKSYGENYGADFKHWSFAVEKMETILRIADGLDLTMEDDDGLIAHNLRTIIIGPDGKLTNIIKGNEWTPEEVATEMKRLVN